MHILSDFLGSMFTHLKAGFVCILDIINLQRKAKTSDLMSFFNIMEVWGFHTEESLEDLTKDIQPLSKQR